MNLLETKNLYHRYRRQVVLNGINLQVPEGCVYGYLGKNGSGKTTTIKLLLGLLPTSQKSIYYWEQDFMNKREILLSRIGNLVELPGYYDNLTGYDNLQCLDFIYSKGKNRIMETLELVGLKNESNKKVKHYSTGMKQRLGIAKAIFHNPDFLILDEPFNGLDPEGIYQMRTLIGQLHNLGKTIFFSSHILNEVEQLCTHIGILHLGKLAYQGELQTLISSTSLESAFLNLIKQPL